MVTSRIDRLPAGTQLLLKAASVIGYSFDTEVLTDIHPTGATPASIGTELRDLEARSFISVDHGTNRTYRFTHAIIRDVAYETLPYSQRRRLHRIVDRPIPRLETEEPKQETHHMSLFEVDRRSGH